MKIGESSSPPKSSFRVEKVENENRRELLPPEDLFSRRKSRKEKWREFILRRALFMGSSLTRREFVPQKRLPGRLPPLLPLPGRLPPPHRLEGEEVEGAQVEREEVIPRRALSMGSFPTRQEFVSPNELFLCRKGQKYKSVTAHPPKSSFHGVFPDAARVFPPQELLSHRRSRK